MIVYLKKLSGEVIPLELSPSDRLYPAVRALGVDPGYTPRLFTQEGEELWENVTAEDLREENDGTENDAEEAVVTVVYGPEEMSYGIVFLRGAFVRFDDAKMEICAKLMMEIRGVTCSHRMIFYTPRWSQANVFIPEDSVRSEQVAEGLEDDELVQLTGQVFGDVEELIEHFIPRIYDEEIRERMKKGLGTYAVLVRDL